MRVVTSRSGALLGFLLSQAAPVAAHADEHPPIDSGDASERLVGKTVLEAQAAAFASLGNECTASGDVVGCSSALFLGGELGAFLTASPWVSIGGVGAFLLHPGVTGTGASDGSSTEVRRQLWHLGGQARFHPFASETLVPWAGIEMGLTSARTTIDRSGFSSGDNGTLTRWRHTPTFAVGLGLDVWLTERAAIVGQFWLAHVGFDGKEANLPDEEPYYTSPWWYALGLGARVRL